MSRINKYNFDAVRSTLPICTYWLKIDMLIVIYVTAQIFCKLQGCKQDSLGRWFSTASEHFYRTCLPAREWYMFKLEKMATDFDRCQLCNGTYSYHLTMPADRHRLFQRMLFGLVSKFLVQNIFDLSIQGVWCYCLLFLLELFCILGCMGCLCVW